jgi:hypothetical protein
MAVSGEGRLIPLIKIAHRLASARRHRSLCSTMRQGRLRLWRHLRPHAPRSEVEREVRTRLAVDQRQARTKC